MVDTEQSLLHAKQDITPSAQVIQWQLRRILDSAEFKATGQQRAMLEFVVSETLAGMAAEIKGYTVATRVFGRSENFDQATDPIVSIQANKLRRALERYYLIAGQYDPVRISIPKGTYVPTFHQHDIAGSGSDVQSEIAPLDSFPCLLVRPFENLTNDPELDYLGIGLAAELAAEITRYQEFKVLMANTEGPTGQVSHVGARFAVDGSVRKDLSAIKVVVNLIDLSNGLHIWCDTLCSEFDPGQLIRFQEQVVRVITAKIASESGIFARFFSAESKHTASSELTTYEAILRYHEFNSHFTPHTFLRAFNALKLATAKEPECGLVWSMLARLYGNNYTLELFDLDTPLEEALAFAQKGVGLEPDNQRSRGILAYVLLLKNNLAAGIAEAKRAIALNPNSLILTDSFGYLLTLLGDWRNGPALINEAIRQNPFHSLLVHHALWVDWLRQGNYQQAYLETLNFRIPTLFWEPLMKAATYGLLGRIEEGRHAAKNLLSLKPEFASRGRILIGHYIKFKEILERIVEGLNKVGLILE